MEVKEHICLHNILSGRISMQSMRGREAGRDEGGKVSMEDGRVLPGRWSKMIGCVFSDLKPFKNEFWEEPYIWFISPECFYFGEGGRCAEVIWRRLYYTCGCFEEGVLDSGD